MQPKLFTGIASSLLLGFCVTIAQAAQTSESKPPLRVGVSPVFPPMVFKQGKELAGVEVDLARALGEHLGRKVLFVEMPWEEQIQALNAGKTDIIMSSMSITAARGFMVSFSQPYFVVGQMALVRREDRALYDLTLFSPVLNCDIGVIKATTGEFLVQREFIKAKRKAYNSGEEAAKALIKKKIDLFINDSPLVWYLAGLHANDGLSVVPKALSQEQLAWAVRKTDDALLNSINEFISRANKDGLMRKTFRRWMAIGE